MKNIKQILSEGYKYPAYTADLVILKDDTILLIKRKNPPFQGSWALPGGFVDPGETAEKAAHRELKEETGVKVSKLVHVGRWDKPDRDPRGQVITDAFKAVVTGDVKERAGDDAKEVKWFDVKKLPSLAFDHKDIIVKALKK
jgi:8-oxo-dGTP diphosphatase